MATEIQQAQSSGNAIQMVRKMLFHPATQEQVFASLPPGLKPDKFAALCLDQLNAMISNLKPELLERALEPGLIMRACQRTAALGLIPGKGAGEVAWIFRKGWNDRPDSIDVMPQWQAYLRLMRQADGVLDVEVQLVHAMDRFSFINGVVEHELDPFNEDRVFLHPDDPRCKGETPQPHGLRGVYVKATFKDGRTRYHLTPFNKITANRLCSDKPGLDGPWGRWYPEQCLKTALRDAAARRLVDWHIDALEKMAAIEQASRDSEQEDPRRGGHVALPADTSPAPALTAVAGGEQPALTAEAPVSATPGMDKLKAKLGVPKAKEAALGDKPSEVVDPKDICPKCGVVAGRNNIDVAAGNCGNCFDK